MTVLTNNAMLRIWEIGEALHPVDQALIVLREAFPDKSWEELARLSPGRRNDFLLTIRERTFGKRLHGLSTCHRCGKGFEFIAEADELRMEAMAGKEGDHQNYELEWGECKMMLRMFDSFDLGAAADCPDLESARALLAERAIVKLVCNGKEMPPGHLSQGGVDAISKKMSECDPNANMKIDVECPECGGELSILFDILSFLWKEISAHARRLLYEVAILARYYAWREADILSLSSARRHYYLEIAETGAR